MEGEHSLHNESTEIDKDNEYSEEELEKWEQGKLSYAQYAKALEQAIKEKSIELEIVRERDVAEIKAMFLGEKPCCFDNVLALETFSLLENFGFRQIGKYVFIPQLVDQAVGDNQDILAPHGIANWEEAMAAVVNLDPARVDHEEIYFRHAVLNGIILGYPRSVVLAFYEYSTNPNNKRHLVDTCGITWAEFDDHPAGEDSLKQQKRLRDALEKSGI